MTYSDLFLNSQKSFCCIANLFFCCHVAKIHHKKNPSFDINIHGRKCVLKNLKYLLVVLQVCIHSFVFLHVLSHARSWCSFKHLFMLVVFITPKGGIHDFNIFTIKFQLCHVLKHVTQISYVYNYMFRSWHEAHNYMIHACDLTSKPCLTK